MNSNSNSNPNPISSLSRMSNDELLAQVVRLAHIERGATASLVAHPAELDARRLHLAEGCSSLFTYCTQVLHLSEYAAYGRIQAARAARRFPVVLERLASGAVNLTAVGLLAPHLTPENHRELLDAARHRSKRQVEELVARVRPLPPIPASIRKLPAPKHDLHRCDVAAGERASTVPSPSGPEVVAAAPTSAHPEAVAAAPASPRPAVIVALAPERYKVQFTASVATYEKLRMAQDLLRHQIPNGDPGAVLDRALSVLIVHITKKKLAATERPRAGRPTARGSRNIPAAVRRSVWKRDGGRCAFVGRNGRRCSERGFLEFHHVDPHANGGVPIVDNIELRCRAHNRYEAELLFGPLHPSLVRETVWESVARKPVERVPRGVGGGEA